MQCLSMLAISVKNFKKELWFTKFLRIFLKNPIRILFWSNNLVSS
jgi:hypothetical protein